MDDEDVVVEIPSMASDYRSPKFVPSAALASRLQVAAVTKTIFTETPEQDPRVFSDLNTLRNIIGETLEAVLFVESMHALATDETRLTVAEASGRFADTFAAALAHRLTLRPYDAPSFLDALYAELHVALKEPLRYSWGRIERRAGVIGLSIEPLPQRLERTSSKSTFYRDLRMI